MWWLLAVLLVIPLLYYYNRAPRVQQTKHSVVQSQIPSATCATVAELRKAIDKLGAGESAVFRLPDGNFNASGPIVIDVTKAAAARAKSIVIEGAGMDRKGTVSSGDSGNTALRVPLKIVASAGTVSKLSFTLKKVTCLQGLDIDTHQAVANLMLQTVHVTVPDPPARDALIFTSCLAAMMVDCEVYGGQEGVFIDGLSCDVHIKDSIVRFAKSRGVFANPHFKVEDVEISECGGYGMKTRFGCKRIGRGNEIQPGPWDKGGWF